MASAPSRTSRVDVVLLWGFLIASGLNIWLDQRSPESFASRLAFYAMMAVFLTHFGYRMWTGVRRRLPHWTRESWRRYAWLVAMPAAALILFFGELYLFDVGAVRPIFGQPQSGLRMFWIVIDLALMLFGAIGLAAAMFWLVRGEPSEQFTRTSWFRRT